MLQYLRRLCTELACNTPSNCLSINTMNPILTTEYWGKYIFLNSHFKEFELIYWNQVTGKEEFIPQSQILLLLHFKQGYWSHWNHDGSEVRILYFCHTGNSTWGCRLLPALFPSSGQRWEILGSKVGTRKPVTAFGDSVEYRIWNWIKCVYIQNPSPPNGRKCSDQ